MLLLHLPSQGAVMCQALAVVTPGHMARHGRSLWVLWHRLPAAWGVLAQHSAESSDDPGRAAMSRCQTLVLEHPLASHQSWPRPRHRSQQWQSHTCGWGWRCGTLCLPSSPALLAHPLLTSAQCSRAWRSPQPGGLSPPHGSGGHQQRAPPATPAGRGVMGASGATWVAMGCVAGRGHSWSSCSPE